MSDNFKRKLNARIAGYYVLLEDYCDKDLTQTIHVEFRDEMLFQMVLSVEYDISNC